VSTILFFVAAVMLGLMVVSKLPGLEHFVKPTVDLLFTFIKFMASNMGAWSIYFLKVFMGSHGELIKHLVLSEATIDPSIDFREKG